MDTSKIVLLWVAVAYAIVAATVLAGFSIAALSNHLSADGQGFELAPCVSEDQVADCYWDAEERGNGVGLSLIAYQGEIYVHEPWDKVPNACESTRPDTN